MARGFPDYGNPSYQLAGVNVDLSTLILVTKGVASLDSKGRILTFETFSEGLFNWSLAKSGSGSMPYALVGTSEISPVSIALVGSDSVSAGYADMRRGFILPEYPRAGLDFAFLAAGQDTTFYVYFTARLSSVTRSGTLKIRPVDQTIEINTPSGWVTIVSDMPNSSLNAWLACKLVCDFENDVYVSFAYGQTKISLTQTLAASGASSQNGMLSVEIQNNDGDNTGDIIYLGHVIVTLDEP